MSKKIGKEKTNMIRTNNVLLKQDMLRPMWRFNKSFACVKGLFVFPVSKDIEH